MPSWHESFVTRAKTDGELRRKLHELARLDSMAMANANSALTANWSQIAQKVDSLCNQVARRVAQPGEDADEAAQWISYHCQEVARALPARPGGIVWLFGLLLLILAAVLAYRFISI